MTKFRKMHGLGNDFVILDARQVEITLSPAQIRATADRRMGVGCDTLAVLYNPKDRDADIFVRYFNADGTESGACGNATRCVADIVMRESGKASCRVGLTYGVLECARAHADVVQVDMGAPIRVWEPDLVVDDFVDPVAINMGNPHCVFFVEDLAAVDNSLEKVGKAVENHVLFPQRTNVEFVQVLSKTKLRQKTWERGAGFTLACGSGACAVAVAAVRRGLTGSKVDVALDGGTLHLEWRESDGHVLMTGPVSYVFEGDIAL